MQRQLVFRVPIDGGPPERLTTDPAEDFAPMASPDGRFVAYHSILSGGTRDIVVRPLEGGGPKQTAAATDREERYPSWSADGNALAYNVQGAGRLEGPGPRIGGIFVVRRNESGTWSGPVRVGEGPMGRVAWLKGTSIVAARADGSIAILPLPAGPPRIVYAPGPTSSDPRARSFVAASRDGQTLYFKSIDAEGRASLWSLAASGGAPRLLVRFNDLSRPSIRADFAAGAGRFFFTLEDRQADIVVAEITRRQ